MSDTMAPALAETIREAVVTCEGIVTWLMERPDQAFPTNTACGCVFSDYLSHVDGQLLFMQNGFITTTPMTHAMTHDDPNLVLYWTPEWVDRSVDALDRIDGVTGWIAADIITDVWQWEH